MKLLFEAVNADPNNEWAYRQLAAVYRETKPQEYDHAIDSAKRAIALSNSDLAYWSLAEVYLDMYDTSSAVQTLQKAFKRFGSGRNVCALGFRISATRRNGRRASNDPQCHESLS
jgi:tetratricopeptide (TPR) repeat protein